MKLASLVVVFSALALVHCDNRSGSPSATGGGPAPVRNAMDACNRFVAAGAASGCHEETVEPALTPGAKQRVLFQLPSGKKGQVMSFDDRDAYDKSAKNIEEMSSAGKHRWGAKNAKIYVQLNKDATEDEAAKVKSVLDGF